MNAADKARLRVAARAARDALDSRWRADASLAVTNHALALPELSGAKIVSAFISFGSEVETRMLVRRLLSSRSWIALPRVDPRTASLEHRRVRLADLDTLTTGSYGIPEPSPVAFSDIVDPGAIDLAFVPGLSFDARGNRLGMGKGYYDRFLREATRATRWGLAFASQVLPEVPVEAHDVPLDGLITDRGVQRFSADPR
jgi:5-formyltetrahydrofolate cyclo-ligase